MFNSGGYERNSTNDSRFLGLLCQQSSFLCEVGSFTQGDSPHLLFQRPIQRCSVEISCQFSLQILTHPSQLKEGVIRAPPGSPIYYKTRLQAECQHYSFAALEC